MLKEGLKVKETEECWCGSISNFHHMSDTTRKDGSRTVWYVCPNKHRVGYQVKDSDTKIKKSKKDDKGEKKNEEMHTQN